MKINSLSYKGTAIVSLLLLAMVIVTCGVKESQRQTYTHSKSDSLAHIRQIASLYMAKPNEALRLLDSAETKRLVPVDEVENLRAMSYQFGLDDTHNALLCANRGYEFAVEHADTLAQLRSLKVLVSIFYEQSHYTNVIVFSNKAMGLAQKINDDDDAMAFFLMALGCAKSEIDNVNDALDYLDRSISIYKTLVNDSNRWTVGDNMLFAMTKKVDILANNGFYDKAIEALPQCQEVLDELKQRGDITLGLNDVREAELLAAAAKAYYGAGDKGKAKECYDRLLLTDYSKSAAGIDLAVPYLTASGQYHEALKCITAKKKYLKERNNTVTYYYIKVLLRNEFESYTHLGMYKEAAVSAHENMVMSDSLRTREKKDYVKEVKKVYADRDMTLQLKDHEQKANTNHLVIIFSSIAMLALALFLTISIRYNRVLRLKDKANLAAMEELRKVYSERTRKHSKLIDADKEVDSDEERKLFTVIHNEIVSRELYLQPGFSRDDAIALVPITMKQFSALFQKYSTGFTSYINNLRLEHSLEVMRNNLSFTIESIALDSGFSNRQTFHRLFVEKYGMTPVEYRRLLEGKNTL